MKPLPLTILVLCLSLCTSLAALSVLDMIPGEEEAALERMDTRIDELVAAVDDLSAMNRDLAERAGPGDDGSPVVREPVLTVEEAMDRWIRKNRPDLLAAETDAAPAETGKKTMEETKEEQAARLLALFDDPDMDDEEWNEVWNQISDAGVMDEALTLLEDHVAREPDNPNAHLALAGGYLGKSVNTANDIEKGMWAIKADKVLDRALELDPWHWEARFTKASCLTYYPPAMGKQGEALKHLETLRDQQKQLPPHAKHAQTFLYLGNLHLQMGNHEKASLIWKEGLDLHPDCKELAVQLENAVKE